MKKITNIVKKTCNHCKEEFVAKTTNGRPVGLNTIVWKKRKYCNKSCAMTEHSKHLTLKNLENRSIGQKLVGRTTVPKNCKNTGRTHFKKGMMTWNKGKKMSKESIEKMRVSRLLYFKNGGITNKGKKMRISAWNKGRKMNKIEIEKMRQYGLKGLLKQQNMKVPTSIEKKLYEELKRRGLLFETQKLIGGKFIVDAYIPSLNLIIEADGDYWHSLPRVVGKDKAENAYLMKCGYKLVRWREVDINSNITNLFDQIELN